MGSSLLLIWLAMVMVLIGLSKGDFDKDEKQCGNTLIGLSTCLPYVSGQAKAPTINCCAGLKPVIQNNKVCLCIMIKDRNDPGLPVKINATLAMGLPDVCRMPSDVTECPNLMKLAPNSTDAKIFEDYAKNNQTTAASTGNASNGKTGSSNDVKSDVGRGNNWLEVEKIWWVLYIVVMFLFQIA